jgi:hypothetical protein
MNPFASGFYTMGMMLWLTYLSFIFNWHPAYEEVPI